MKIIRILTPNSPFYQQVLYRASSAGQPQLDPTPPLIIFAQHFQKSQFNLNVNIKVFLHELWHPS
ncbi:hypothetical protein G8764_10960 [Pseudomaricurvus alcaniphilus]|uniref:hypothetical protein n=1 Tax=Pseudomaricurvus alcaniphilus TaxID=1166482 RepID=UPI00140B664E|nr:hypothetical protein [Pseudomaricurvus alcaniphilus]NHN37817.1 hypothetical protein [Pseudomaricurvus alcaniphilus]